MARKTAQRSAIGGASGEAGAAVRAGIVAVLAAHLLRGWDIPALGLSSGNATPVTVELETDDPVDDIGSRLNGGGRAYIQAKRELSLSVQPGSPFVKAITQCKRAVCSRGLDPQRDRLVLACESATAPIRDLGAALRRTREQIAGAPSSAEAMALTRLDSVLDDLESEQRDLLQRCLVVWIVNAEEPSGDAAVNAALMLDGPVVALGEGRRAFIELARLGRDKARLRQGFDVHGPLLALREADLHLTADAQGVVAAQMVERQRAAARHCRRIQQAGETLDLLGVGAGLPPLPLEDVDAEVRVTEPSFDEERPSERHIDLVLRRRGRLFLTGLPGAGKSTALAATAADQARRVGAPLPLVARLDQVARRLDAPSFLDALLDVASAQAVGPDRALLREEFVSALTAGRCTLFLDALDEARARRGDVISGLRGLLGEVHPDVEVLLATRDAARPEAESLGFHEARLVAPSRIDDTVAALLHALAAHRRVPYPEAWIEARRQWLDEALRRDAELRRTPLMPVLLTLTAAAHGDAESLPNRRAEVLRAAVSDVVREWEARRMRERTLRLGTLEGERAAEALQASFAEEASVLVATPLPSREDVVAAVAPRLERDWALAPGDARGTAREAVAFWDEAGFFLIAADGRVSPRVRLFVELGEAWHVADRPRHEQARWVGDAIGDLDRVETLKLAAGLSNVVADEFVARAAATGAADECFAACEVLREGGDIGTHRLRELVAGLLTVLGAGGNASVRAARELAMLPVPHDQRGAVSAAFAADLPADHATVARAVSTLCWPDEPGDEDLLRAVLAMESPKPVERPRPAGLGVLDLGWGSDPGWSRAVAGAAERLVSHSRSDAELAARLLGKTGRSTSETIADALRAGGHKDLVDAYYRQLTRMSRGIVRWGAELERFRQADRRLLSNISDLAEPAPLSSGQQRRLDELVDLYFTLCLPDAGAFEPFRVILDDPPTMRTLVEAAVVLGGFDRSLLAAEARRLLDEMEADGDDHVSGLVFIPGQARDMNRWADAEDPGALAQRLIRVLGSVRFAAWAAFQGLSFAPDELGIATHVTAILERLTGWHRRLAEPSSCYATVAIRRTPWQRSGW